METFELDNDPDALADFLEQRGWGDGLPLVVPTMERVSRMLDANPEVSPGAVVGAVPPSFRRADVQALAVNAVMAGCRPIDLPALAAMVRAVIEPTFNLEGVQPTTHPCAPLAVFSAAASKRFGVNAGVGAFGPGTRANATLGRALRLVLMNIGGARPGDGDAATLGHPGKYTFVIGENADAFPTNWPRLSAQFGDSFSSVDDEVVTVLAAEAPRNVVDGDSTNGIEILVTIADTLRTTGQNHLRGGGHSLIVFGPEQAQILADDGIAVDDIRKELFDRCWIPVRSISPDKRASYRRINKRKWDSVSDNDQVPIMDAPKSILVTVAGGPGRHSMIVPTFRASEPATMPTDIVRVLQPI